MYAILASIALAIYSLILVDFSLLFQEMSVNADIITSTQALYAAEGAVESTFGVIGEGDRITRNIRFNGQKTVGSSESEAFLEYNEGADSFYIEKSLSLSEPDLKVADAYHPSNRAVISHAYLAEGQTLDQKAFYGLEPRSAKGFAFREVAAEDNFNAISLEFGEAGASVDVLVDLFVFPREGSTLDFLDFDQLKEGAEGPVQRVVINTSDDAQNGRAFTTDGQPLTVRFGSFGTDYAKQVDISGFEPLTKNYILRFQTLDNQPVSYKLSASAQGSPVVLPSMMQTIDVIGVVPTGLYQRVKYQRQTEQELMPGLNFVHFSDKAIHK
jgi:hypothetical protein